MTPHASFPWYHPYVSFDEPYAAWTVALLAALVAYLLLSLTTRIVAGRAKAIAARTPNSVDDMVADVLAATSRWVLAAVAVLFGLGLIDLPARWSAAVDHLWFAVIVLQAALWLNQLVTIVLRLYVARHATRGMTQVSASATLLSWGVRTVLWTIGLLAALSNLGINITAFVASLGVGGVAVALAVQNILGDLFASLSIAVDKPFEVGDAIAFGAVNGTVEHIGLKTTRIRSLTGEQIVISNTELLKQTISNYKRMKERRIVFKFGLSYDTTPAQAAQVPEILRKIIASSDRLRFDRAHLQGLGESSLDYEVVYYVREPDYVLYMDLQQSINLRLLEALQTLGAELAFPTRTVQIERRGAARGPASATRERPAPAQAAAE